LGANAEVEDTYECGDDGEVVSEFEGLDVAEGLDEEPVDSYS
jgi:hypothetical protein